MVVVGIAIVAAVYGVSSTIALTAAFGIIVAEVIALSLRTSRFGMDLPFARYLAALVVAAALVIITFNGWRLNEHVAYSDVLLVIAAVLLVTSIALDGIRPMPRLGWLLFSTCLLALSGAVSSLSSSDPSAALSSTLEFCLALFGVAVIISITGDSPRRAAALTSLWAFSAGINGAVAVLDATHVTSIGPRLIGAEFYGRVAGLTIHPNHLGIVCAMVLPVCLSRVAVVHERRYRSAWLAVLCLTALGVLVSGSRAATIAGAAGLVLVPLIQRQARARVVKYLAAGIVAFAALAVYAAPNDSTLLVSLARVGGGQSATASDVGRLQAFRDAISAFESSPFTGHGFDLIRGAHDIYLQLLQAGGVLALGAFALFATGAVLLGLKLARSEHLSPQLRAISASLVASLAVWFIAGLAQNHIYERVLYIPVGMLLAIELVERRQKIRRIIPMSEQRVVTDPMHYRV